MNAEDRGVATAVGACLGEVARAIEWASSSITSGGRLIYVGAGTSGRLAVLDASECPPTFGVDPGVVIAVIAGGERAILHSVEGAEDDRVAGAATVDSLNAGSEDTVVGVAASGSTPFTEAALRRARELGARTIALTANPESAMQHAADITICTVVGPEVLTGSTRLKCATAHKMVLNMISTGCMVRAGKVFKNLMVDVQPTNDKLKRRAARIVCQAAGVEEDAARVALAESGMDVKVAVTMCLARVEVDTARRSLVAAGGFVDRALEILKGAR